MLNTSLHPLEIVARDPGADFFNDVVLLGTDFPGSFQQDAAVNWTDDGNEPNRKLSFTLTPELATAMQTDGVPGYRCSVHSASMRGRFVVIYPPTETQVAIQDALLEGSGDPSGLDVNADDVLDAADLIHAGMQAK